MFSNDQKQMKALRKLRFNINGKGESVTWDELEFSVLGDPFTAMLGMTAIFVKTPFGVAVTDEQGHVADYMVLCPYIDPLKQPHLHSLKNPDSPVVELLDALSAENAHAIYSRKRHEKLLARFDEKSASIANDSRRGAEVKDDVHLFETDLWIVLPSGEKCFIRAGSTLPNSMLGGAIAHNNEAELDAFLSKRKDQEKEVKELWDLISQYFDVSGSRRKH